MLGCRVTRNRVRVASAGQAPIRVGAIKKALAAPSWRSDINDPAIQALRLTHWRNGGANTVGPQLATAKPPCAQAAGIRAVVRTRLPCQRKAAVIKAVATANNSQATESWDSRGRAK